MILGVDPGSGGALTLYKKNKIQWAIKCPETISLMAKYVKATLHPALANFSTIPFPIPFDPPVIIAVLFLRSFMFL